MILFLQINKEEIMSQARNESKATSEKHLLLFVDINGTITVSDSAKSQNTDAALNKLLAENTTGIWESNTTQMSYRKFVDTKYKDAKKDERENYYVNFIKHLEESEHAEAKNIKKVFNELKENLKNKNIFSSFTRLIEKLNKEQVKYSVILRTFGNDLDSTIEELKKETGIEFKQNASFEKHSIKEHKISDTKEMIDFFKQGHRGVKDEHAYWSKEHKETYAGGKPYPIHLDDSQTISIFFDDNALWKQILSVKLHGNEVLNQESLQKELASQNRIISVDTLKAIHDSNYFINIVENVLKNELNKVSILAAAQENYKTIRFFNSSSTTQQNSESKDSSHQIKRLS